MPRAAEPTGPLPTSELAPDRNEVLLSGRLSGVPVERELDSGDVVVTFRLVVRRPGRSRSARPGGHRVSVDTVDCSVWRSDARRVLARVADGDLLAVDGALRRRFFRAGGAAVSRYEVEVARIRRIGRPAAGATRPAAGAPVPLPVLPVPLPVLPKLLLPLPSLGGRRDGPGRPPTHDQPGRGYGLNDVDTGGHRSPAAGADRRRLPGTALPSPPGRIRRTTLCGFVRSYRSMA